MNRVSIPFILLAGIASLLTSCAMFEQPAEPRGGGRAVAILMDAQVTAIDYETREVSLRGPFGNIVTLTAGDHIERFENIAVDDIVATTYIASLVGELREPTEEEIANPWVEIDGAATATPESEPGAIVGRMIRAVCSIEGMNRLTGSVTVLDSRGKYHVISDVDPEEMEGVTLGDTIVLTYSEAMAITLEKR